MRPYNQVQGFTGLPYAPRQPPVVSNIQPFYTDHAGADADYGRSASAKTGADVSLADSPLANLAYAALGLGVGAAFAYLLVRKS